MRAEPIGDEVADAGAQILLIDGDGQAHRGQQLTGGVGISQRPQHRGQAALHIGGAAAGEPVAGDPRLEGIARPAGPGGHDIRMSEEQQTGPRRAAAACRQRGGRRRRGGCRRRAGCWQCSRCWAGRGGDDDVRPARSRLGGVDEQAVGDREPGDDIDGGRFGAAGILTSGADEIPGQLHDPAGQGAVCRPGARWVGACHVRHFLMRVRGKSVKRSTPVAVTATGSLTS